MHPPHHEISGDMHSIDVILAIGAVWLGLMEANIDFAYANSDLFSSAHSMRRVGMHAVKGPNHFLMPLLFNEESRTLSPEAEEDTVEPLKPVFSAFQRGQQERHQEHLASAEKARKKGSGNKIRSPTPLEDQKVQNKGHKGDIGHFVLAIVEKISTDPANNVKGALSSRAPVRLKIMDSADGVVDKGLIRRVARNTVRHAGWLGDIWPRFDESEEYWSDVLEQSGNKSGEHTVLNAWAYMLNIPLATTRKRKLGHVSYKEVRKMINLAFKGQLDSLTIRAWMQHSKYAVDVPFSQLQQIQMPQPDLPNELRNMQTVALNHASLDQIVMTLYAQEQAEKQNHTMDWGDVTNEPDGQLIRMKVTPSVTVPTSGRNSIPTQDPVSRQDPAFGQHPASRQDPASRHDPASREDPDSRQDPAIGQHPVSRQDPNFSEHPASASSQDSDTSSLSIYASVGPPRNDAYPKTWQQSLVYRLNRNKTQRANTHRRTDDALKNATVIHSCSEMADYDVVLGIAPIWEGLNRLSRPDLNFAFAGMDIFAPARAPEDQPEIIGAIGRWSRFIMPLFFSKEDSIRLEKQGKGKGTIEDVGHLLLCVAELVDVAEARERPAMTVQLEILDSSPGAVSEEDILRKAKSTIKDSCWLARKGRQGRVKYKLIVRKVPRQVGSNTCGLYTILNAWAYMLGIPIHPHDFRRGRDETTLNDAIDSEFLRQGLEIVNLALKGFMDSATIQAFFHAHGYSVEQRFGDSSRAAVKVYAIGMNQDKLGRTLHRWRMIEKTASARAENKQFNEEDMRTLMNNNNLTEDDAWMALVMGKGHVDRALAWWITWNIQGQLQPEEALSPQTPAWKRLVGQQPPREEALQWQALDPRDRS